MPNTGKGIYIKTNAGCDSKSEETSGSIENILYENIHISKPIWWSIWIGPQQQREPHTEARECGLVYPFTKTCNIESCMTLRNITLRNIVIEDPLISPGVIFGNQSNPITGLTFDNVTVVKGNVGDIFPFGSGYQCSNTIGAASINSSPPLECH